MDNSLQNILFEICNELFTGFAMYTLVYFILRIFKTRESLRVFDRSAAIAIFAVSILFLLLWIFSEIYLKMNDTPELWLKHWDRMTGKYWFGYWLPPLPYTLLPSLLLWRKIRENILWRSLIAFFLFVNFAILGVIVDYVLEGSSAYEKPFHNDPFIVSHALRRIFEETLEFCFLAAVIFFIRRKKANFAV